MNDFSNMLQIETLKALYKEPLGNFFSHSDHMSDAPMRSTSTFIRFIGIGIKHDKPVAEFCAVPQAIEGWSEWCIDEAGLRKRISDFERDYWNPDVEQIALAALLAHKAKHEN